MVWISIIIIFLIVLVAVILVFYFNRKMLLRDITGLFNKVFKLFNEVHNFSKENAFILDNECKESKIFLLKIENLLASPPSNKELESFYQHGQVTYKQLEEKIKEKKNNWSIFSEFKENLPYLFVNIRNKTQEIVQNGERLILENEDMEDVIRERINQQLLVTEELINEYKTLDKAGFNDFNFYILEDLDQEYSQVMEHGKNLLKEISFFYKEFKITLEDICRKSNFYITLEENEEEKRGKKRLKEILVSYKTYRETSPGKAYDRQFTVSKKRAVTNQSIKIKIQIDDGSYLWMQELENEEFAELFKELKFPFTEDRGEDGLPLEIERVNQNIPLCTKKAKSFELEHDTIFFQQLKVYELVEELLKNQFKAV